ncbi:hypothetical protein GF324_13670, partial [bacterium]|nr:hypothetical protein [bacterium]
MAVITIFSGPYCHGDEVTRGVVETLGYRPAGEELFKQAANQYNMSEERLQRSLYGSPSLLGRFTTERARALAYLKATLAHLLQEDGIVLHGFLTHLIPLHISNVLRVCLIANNDYRAKLAMETDSLSEEKALKRIHEEDSKRGEWTRHVRYHDPYDERLYDMLLAMQSTSVKEAVESISSGVSSETLKRTEETERAIADFALAANVEIALTEKGYDVNVTSDNGNIHIAIQKYTNRLESTKAKLKEIAQQIDGVQAVSSSPGTRYTP